MERTLAEILWNRCAMYRALRLVGVLLCVGRLMVAHAGTLDERAKMWRQNAPLCPAGASWATYPTKLKNEAQRCNDGDMTLFLGLLCASGESELACTGVKEAQNKNDSQWARSPRIRALGRNDEGDAYFSPDMALGLQLYFLTKRDPEHMDAAWKWLMWLHQNVGCPVTLFGWCPDALKFPRVCTEVDGCYLTHGALAVLASTVNFLQKNAGLPDLPDGPLRGRLGTFSGAGPIIEAIDADWNKEGFSQHLVGVAIMVLRKAGTTDDRLDQAARTLAERNPKNAFFAYLAKGQTSEVEELTLARCPASPAQLEEPLNEWQWERGDSTGASSHSIYWDCVFMFNLLRQH